MGALKEAVFQSTNGEEPSRGVQTQSAPSFEAVVGDVTQDLDPSLGRGAAGPIFQALQHFTDDDATFPSFGPVMLAQGAPAPSVGPQAAPTVAPSNTPPKKTARKGTPKPAKKQRDNWDKIEATTDNRPGGYDIQWMRQLDPRVLKSIDGEYADDVADVKVAKRVASDKQIASIDKQRKAAVDAIRKRNGTTKPKGAKEAPPDILADAAGATWDVVRAQREFEIRTELEKSATAREPKKSVSIPNQGTRKVRRADLQTRKRANYVADVNSLSRSHASTRKHLESFRAVKGTDMRKRGDGTLEKNPHAMMLSGDTADRFELAADRFHTAHPRHSIPTTSVGYGTRGLHEEEQGLGYLGHMLGTTFDLFAVENPNLDGPEGEGDINGFMLRKFGRDRTTNKPGRTQLDNFSDADIEAMGRRTASGTGTRDELNKDATLEAKVRAQYREMSQTSQNFKGDNSLGKDSMDALRDARERYFQLEESRKQEAALQKQLKAAPDSTDLQKQLAILKLQNVRSDDQIRAVMQASFQPWQDELQADMAKTRADTTHDEVWKANELAVLERTAANFADPERVFGSYHESTKTKGKLVADEKASNAPIMQFLEKGFIRDDGMDYSKIQPGAVFNEDVFATLVRHGFGPGSRFRDTMHFDFIESQSKLVPGGRSQINMKADRASPEKDLPDAPAPAPMKVPTMVKSPPLAPLPTMLDVAPNETPGAPYRPKGIFDP